MQKVGDIPYCNHCSDQMEGTQPRFIQPDQGKAQWTRKTFRRTLYPTVSYPMLPRVDTQEALTTFNPGPYKLIGEAGVSSPPCLPSALYGDASYIKQQQ